MQAPQDGKPYWLLDFGRKRLSGPGRAALDAPVQSFNLNGGFFAEESCALYDPQRGKLLFQYNHHGAKAATIAQYLSRYQHGGTNSYEFRIKLNQTAQARLARKRIFSKLIVKVAPAELTDDFRVRNVALSTALLRCQQDFGGDVVTIEVGLERGSQNSLNLRDKIESLWELATTERTATSRAEVYGRDGDDLPIDPVNLIKEKLEMVYPGLGLDDGGRIRRVDRWARLEWAHDTWARDRII